MSFTNMSPITLSDPALYWLNVCRNNMLPWLNKPLGRVITMLLLCQPYFNWHNPASPFVLYTVNEELCQYFTDSK